MKTIYVNPAGKDQRTGLNPNVAKKTIQSAVGTTTDQDDEIQLALGQYNETVTIAAAKSGLTIKGSGGRGASYIEPETAGAEGMTVLADDVTLHNVGVAADDTGDYSLKVGSQTVSPARFRAYGCKFESKPVVLQGVGDTLFEDCEFNWEGALHFAANDNGYCTQVTLVRCRFLNITEAHLKSLAAGGVRNLILDDCVFEKAEDGTARTQYLDLDETGDTGMITNCKFATPTNEADVLTIAAGISWVDNATEAGRSTARPS